MCCDSPKSRREGIAKPADGILTAGMCSLDVLDITPTAGAGIRQELTPDRHSWTEEECLLY